MILWCDIFWWYFLFLICFVFQTQGQLRNSSNRAERDVSTEGHLQYMCCNTNRFECGPSGWRMVCFASNTACNMAVVVVRGSHNRHIYLIYPISELRNQVWHLAALTCNFTLRQLAVNCILGGMSRLLQAFLASCHVDYGSHGEKPNGLRLYSMSLKCFPLSPVCCSSASTLK